MNDYKHKIQKRMTLMGLAAVFIIAGYGFSRTLIDDPNQLGFLTGLLIALEILILATIAKLYISSRSETGLRKLFVSEGDERKALILEKTSRAGIIIYALGIGGAAGVAKFVNETVFITLLAVLTFMALIKVVLRVYFQRKY